MARIKLLNGLCFAIAISIAFSGVIAQTTKTPLKFLGVDAIKTSKQLLYGFVLARNANGSIECAIDRQWLQGNFPDLALQAREKEKKNQNDVNQLSITRVQSWLASCTEEKQIRLKLFLEDELIRIQGFRPEEIQSTFVILTFSANEITKLTIAKPEQRRIAGLAYKHDLPDVTTTATAALERQLKEMNVDPKTETFDLTGKLPVLTQETDQQWAARQALVEFELVESFELQGKGDTLMAAGDPIDPMALLKELSAAQNELLNDLAKELKLDLGTGIESKDKESWKSVAASKAEKKKVRGVLVQRLQQDLGTASVKVLTDFLARAADGKWFSVYHAEVSDDGSKVTQEDLDRLQQDPNLKQLLPMIDAFGGKGQLDKALRQGAATSAALGEARNRFTEFKIPHTRSLLSAPIQFPN